MRPGPLRLYLYGYRMNEIDYPKIMPCKKSLKFLWLQSYKQQRGYRRILSTSLPICFTPTPPRVDPGHTPSYVGGTIKRMGYEPPPIKRKTKLEFKKFVRLWCIKNLKPLTEDEIPSVAEWLETVDYPEARKKELRRAWRKYQKNPCRKTLKRVKSFIKDETYAEYKYPRLINSRVDVAKCLFGPLCAIVSKKLFALPQFIKNIPVDRRPLALRDHILVDGQESSSTDYASFEAHFTKTRMSMTTKILFRHMTKNCSSYTRKLSETMLTTLQGKNVIQNKIAMFIIEATRCSGEMDTSLSNGFTNSMNIEYLAWKKKCQVKYFVEGDDGISSWIPASCTPTEEEFRELGWNIKVDRSKDLACLSFCGQVYDTDDLVVVTDITEQLARVGWTNQRYVSSNRNTLLQLLRAKGFSLSYQYNGCPILGVLGRRILEMTESVQIEKRIIDQYDSYHKPVLLKAIENLPPFKEPGSRTRLLVEKLYGIDFSAQIQIENQFKNLEFGVHELPVQPPKLWEDYFQKYSHDLPDPDPAWLLKEETEYVNYLKGFSNVAEKLHS
jgi:hypothetical protein